MSKANEPAFPVINSDSEYHNGPVTDVYSTGGLSKREYFAGLALNGMLKAGEFSYDRYDKITDVAESYSERAIIIADTILARLHKENQK